MLSDGILEGPSVSTGASGSCSDCVFFRAFPWYVQRHDGYCGRTEVSHNQVGSLFVSDSDHMCCRLHLSMSDYLAAIAGDRQGGGPRGD